MQSSKHAALADKGGCEGNHMTATAMKLLHKLVKRLHKCGLGDSANDHIHLLAALEDHDCWDTANAVVCCDAWALICVELELCEHTTQFT